MFPLSYQYPFLHPIVVLFIIYKVTKIPSHILYIYIYMYYY
jgi:hypothetical protein